MFDLKDIPTAPFSNKLLINELLVSGDSVSEYAFSENTNSEVLASPKNLLLVKVLLHAPWSSSTILA